jgi:hypothetical protein
MSSFNKSLQPEKPFQDPDNTQLLNLLSIYWNSDGLGETYKNVVSELMTGNSFLMLPTLNVPTLKTDGWEKTTSTTRLALATIVPFEGRKALRAFTDEEPLLKWMKGPHLYTSMRSQDVLKLCVANGISRLIINNGSLNTFVLEGKPDA